MKYLGTLRLVVVVLSMSLLAFGAVSASAQEAALPSGSIP